MWKIYCVLVCASLMIAARALGAVPQLGKPVDMQAPPPAFVHTVEGLKQATLLRAGFEQRKHLKVLKQPFITRGHMLFSAKNGIYWEINAPVQSAYVIGKQGIRALGTANKHQALPMGEQVGGMFAAILAADMAELQKIFTIHYTTEENGWQIGLQPRQTEIIRFIKSIEFGGERYIERVLIHEAHGDVTEIIFSNVRDQPAQLSAQERAYFADDR